MRRFAVVAAVISISALAACSDPEQERIKATSIPTYDPSTGKLTRLTADLNKNGKIDTWTYMDGAKIIRAEQDRNEDGKVDRWEYLRPDGTVEKAIVSATGDINKISRWEKYEQGRLVLVEEDTNGDDRPDKWEVHDGVPILSVEFDLNFDGVRDQRLTYGPNGTVEWIESEPDGRSGYLKKVKPK